MDLSIAFKVILKFKSQIGTSFRGLFCHVGGTGGPGRAPWTGGRRSKGTTNWPETAHRAIWPRAKMYKFGRPRSRPLPAPDVGLWRGSIQLKGHCFFIHSEITLE